MRRSKIIAFSITLSILVQPLGLVSPVLAATVEMEYSDPEHIHAPKVVRVCSSALQCASDDYEYDANGNLIYDGERKITWNQDNLPTKIEKDGKVVEFFYDAGGRRILKRSGQDKVVYVSSSYEQSTINNKQSSTKYYFANGRIALGSSALRYLHQDHLGSTVLATDSNSQPVSESLSYFPYGSSINNQQLTISNYLFTGQEKDPESALYNYNARLYNPKTGAFVSAGFVQGPNHYAYAGNNPMVFADPTGNDPEKPNLGDVLVEYGPAIAFGTFSEWVAGLNIPVVSPLFTEFAIGSKKIIRGGITGDTALQAEGLSNVAYGFIGVYTGIQTAGTVIEYGKFAKDYYYYNYFPYQSPVPEGVTVRQALPGEITPAANVHPYSGAEGLPPGGFFLGSPETQTGEIVLDERGWWEFKLPMVPAPGYEHEVEHWWQFVERGYEPAASWPEFAYDEICAMEAELELFQRWGYQYIPPLYEYETGYIQKEMSGWEEILTGWYNRGRGAYEGW